jgi:ketosteroid isomerase-like protein
MTRDDAVKVFNHQQAAWNARDPGALARDYADDGTVISPIFRTVQGQAAIVES